MIKNAHLEDLKKCFEIEYLVDYLLAKIGVDTAENGPKVDVWGKAEYPRCYVGSTELLVLLILSPEYAEIFFIFS